MAQVFAQMLFETGRSHTMAFTLLYQAALEEGQRKQVADVDRYAFNGPYSLSIHYLLGLGLELMLKAAIVAWGGPSDERALRDIGHDLTKALNIAEEAGFRSEAPHLRELVEVLGEPFRRHWFRYERPDQIELPGSFEQTIASLEVLDHEIRARFLWNK